MTTNRTVEERVGDWQRAFNAIREEVTPPVMRNLMANLQGVENTNDLGTYVGLARLVMANDRMSALVAAMLTQAGVSRPVIEDNDD